MGDYEIEQRIRHFEQRYETVSRNLVAARHEFEILSRTPVDASLRLARLVFNVERLTRVRACLSQQRSELEDMVA